MVIRNLELGRNLKLSNLKPKPQTPNPIAAPYHIIITRKNQVLLSFLKIRLIINGTDIYPLAKDKPVVIPIKENNPKIVATDGYHFTKPLELVYHHIHTYHFKVVCIIDDFQMAVGFAFLVILFLLGIATGFLGN